MRDDTSRIRPTLYDRDDPVRADDVKVVLEALEDARCKAMDKCDPDRVTHVSNLMRRIANAAGEGYEEWSPPREEEEEA